MQGHLSCGTCIYSFPLLGQLACPLKRRCLGTEVGEMSGPEIVLSSFNVQITATVQTSGNWWHKRQT